ncbi:DUF7547 family protein [Halocatena marina]|uniref:Uncharacterized protein n=1 Tax=Halocatena marina TaxID=2934937 RepID=A0ABD5YLU8_9EURY|nr:hypothetical protein [Halocatena marina]
MSRRHDDDLDELLSELSGTLSELQDVLADEERHRQPRDQHQTRERRRPPSPRRFLRFTEEHTIPTLISLLETNIRALELLQGLLRLVNGRDDGRQSDSTPFKTSRRVRTTGRRTLDTLDDALSDLQGALDGEPTDSEARTLLDDARALREEIDTQLTGARTEQSRSNSRDRDQDQDREQSQGQEDDGVITIDVEEETDSDENEDTDELSVDDELDTIKRELRDDDDQGHD